MQGPTHGVFLQACAACARPACMARGLPVCGSCTDVTGVSVLFVFRIFCWVSSSALVFKGPCDRAAVVAAGPGACPGDYDACTLLALMCLPPLYESSGPSCTDAQTCAHTNEDRNCYGVMVMLTTGYACVAALTGLRGACGLDSHATAEQVSEASLPGCSFIENVCCLCFSSAWSCWVWGRAA